MPGGAAGFAAAAAAVAAAAAAAAAAQDRAVGDSVDADSARPDDVVAASTSTTVSAASPPPPQPSERTALEEAAALQQALAMHIAALQGADTRNTASPGGGVGVCSSGGGGRSVGASEWSRVMELLQAEQQQQLQEQPAAAAAQQQQGPPPPLQPSSVPSVPPSSALGARNGDASVSPRQAAQRVAAFAQALLQTAGPSVSASTTATEPAPSPLASGVGKAVVSPGVALRGRMHEAARQKRFQEAHRLLDELWSVEPTLIEPRLLLWAAQRRTNGPRLWWGAAERETARAMLERALESARLDAPSTQKALEGLEVLRVAHDLHASHNPTAREMASLQSHLSAWVAAHGGASMLGCWERPSAGSAVPAHIKKMARRYDTLRAALLRISTRGEGAGLFALTEETASQAASSARSDASAAQCYDRPPMAALGSSQEATYHDPEPQLDAAGTAEAAMIEAGAEEDGEQEQSDNGETSAASLHDAADRAWEEHDPTGPEFC